MDALREYLYPEVVAVVDDWLRHHTLQQLVEDPKLRAKLELALEEALRTTFGQSGLKFLQARTVELNLEPYDHVRGVRGKYTLLDMEALIDLEGRKRKAGPMLRSSALKKRKSCCAPDRAGCPEALVRAEPRQRPATASG